jgi:hypothetical protein
MYFKYLDKRWNIFCVIFCSPINKKFKDDLLFDEKLIYSKNLQYRNSNFNSNNNENIDIEKNMDNSEENKNKKKGIDSYYNNSIKKKVNYIK